ncbi:hypothetical protein AB0B39_12540 [Micromonospora sp. NPDC049114]|uniref:hypothetical protein n=1 Tax=Micromonospora sp. NPDC049114 TaxID=3155498 RepID=UPI0033F5913E
MNVSRRRSRGRVAHRARAHVAARRPRGPVSATEARRALQAFQRSVESGDVRGLLDVLAPDVVLLGDGGGIKQAALRPVVGADRVARLLASRKVEVAALSLHPAEVNGWPALIVRSGGALDTVPTVRVDDGLVSGLYAVRSPEKLSHMQQATALRR